jgi:hypothetical protein
MFALLLFGGVVGWRWWQKAHAPHPCKLNLVVADINIGYPPIESLLRTKVWGEAKAPKDPAGVIIFGEVDRPSVIPLGVTITIGVRTYKQHFSTDKPEENAAEDMATQIVQSLCDTFK